MPAPIGEYVPQFVSAEEARSARRRAWAAWAVLVSGAGLFLATIVLAPLALAHGHIGIAHVIYGGFSVACHQMPERSFQVSGFPLAVCARCLGLYAGAGAGALLYPLLRSLGRRDAPARGWLIAAALPTTIDFALGSLGIWPNTHLSRFATAALLGAVAAFFIAPAVLAFGRSGWRPFFRGGLAADS
jgi:uncharacterized membrane protein